MQEITSHIDIAAPAWLVWAILADFRTYGRWNPLIRGVLGRPVTGRRIEIRVRTSSGTDVNARPTISRVQEPREMKWVENWRVPGLFSSERRFRIEALPDGSVRFHHGERVHGLLVTMLGLRRRMRTMPGFNAMNNALKQRAERAWAHGPRPS